MQTLEDFSESTYTVRQCICEHPRLIINPLLPELIARYKCYFMRGYQVIVQRSHIHWYDFDYKPFSIKRNDITTADIDSCFVVDRDTGETFPIYIQVPCNHCSVCKQRKVFGFVQRCKMETQCYDSRPWFVTLTYDNAHLPENGSLNVRDVQLFLKRLRINLERSGYKFKIRYVLVGEYGKPHNTFRPHYHMLLWGLDTFESKDHKIVSQIIYDSWKNGFIVHRMVDPKDDKVFYYTSKYLRKDCATPEGCKPPFVFPQTGTAVLARPLLTDLPRICDVVLTQNLNSLINGLEDQRNAYFLSTF